MEPAAHLGMEERAACPRRISHCFYMKGGILRSLVSSRHLFRCCVLLRSIRNSGRGVLGYTSYAPIFIAMHGSKTVDFPQVQFR